MLTNKLFSLSEWVDPFELTSKKDIQTWVWKELELTIDRNKAIELYEGLVDVLDKILKFTKLHLTIINDFEEYLSEDNDQISNLLLKALDWNIVFLKIVMPSTAFIMQK